VTTQLQKQLLGIVGPVARAAIKTSDVCIVGDSVLKTNKASKRNQRVHLDDTRRYLIVLVYLTRCKPTRSMRWSPAQAALMERVG
jgi:hypothetical protein